MTIEEKIKAIKRFQRAVKANKEIIDLYAYCKGMTASHKGYGCAAKIKCNSVACYNLRCKHDLKLLKGN